MTNICKRRPILSAIGFLVFALPALAQAGTITGLITDVSGAVVSGAHVIVLATTTG